MEKFYRIIDSANVADGSKALYKRQLAKLYEKLPKKTYTILKDVPMIKKSIESIYSNKESQKTMYNAVILITRLYKGLPNGLYEEYRKIRDELRGVIKEQKSENVIQDENKWMSRVEELKSIPQMIQEEIEKKYGELFLSERGMRAIRKANRIQYIKSFLKWGFIYIVINYPLRLDYFNLPLKKTDGNYMVREGNKLTLHLSKFKNVRSMGEQVIEYDVLSI
jgi:hypothetical protein